MKTAFAPNRDVTSATELDPNSSHVIIPTTYEPGNLSSFYLTVYTEEHIQECAEIKDDFKVKLEGSWNSNTAGGCLNHNSWVQNPKWKLSIDGEFKQPVQVNLSVTLHQLQAKDKELYYIALYGGKWTGSLTRDSIQYKVDNVNSSEGLSL